MGEFLILYSKMCLKRDILFNPESIRQFFLYRFIGEEREIELISLLFPAKIHPSVLVTKICFNVKILHVFILSCNIYSFSGAFENLQKATVSLFMFVRPHGRTHFPVGGFPWKLIFEDF